MEDAYYTAVILAKAPDSHLRRCVIGQPIPLQRLLKRETTGVTRLWSKTTQLTRMLNEQRRFWKPDTFL